MGGEERQDGRHGKDQAYERRGVVMAGLVGWHGLGGEEVDLDVEEESLPVRACM